MYNWGKSRDVRNVKNQIMLADSLGNLEIDTDLLILEERLPKGYLKGIFSIGLPCSSSICLNIQPCRTNKIRSCVASYLT